MEITFDDRDDFKRRSIAENIKDTLNSDIDISPLVLDGGWGVGKTEFTHKLINLMKSSGDTTVVYVDAYKADHANNPLATILSEVINALPEENEKSSLIKAAIPALKFGFKTLAKAGISHVLRQDYADAADEFEADIKKATDKAIEAAAESIFKTHLELEKNLRILKESLTQIAEQKQLVIFIDELDRCRPSFAIDVLEVIKHTFDVDNVKFVLVTNTAQLKASVNHCYGHTVDAQKYLDKFIKLTVALPKDFKYDQTERRLVSVEHYGLLVNQSALLSDKDICQQGYVNFVGPLVSVNSISLREIESVVRHLEIYTLLSDGKYLKNPSAYGLKLLTIFSVACYCLKPELAASILDDNIDFESLSAFLGVKSLAQELNDYPDESEMIYFLLAISGGAVDAPFTIPSKDNESWKQAVTDFFGGRSLHGIGSYLSICQSVMNTLTYR